MLVNALSKFAQDHRELWHGHLVEVVYSYSTMVKVSTHRSPFEVMDVPIQSDTYDCRLFTITFATALTQGEKTKCFFFDQWNMREYLQQCFEDGEMNQSSESGE